MGKVKGLIFFEDESWRYLIAKSAYVENDIYFKLLGLSDLLLIFLMIYFPDGPWMSCQDLRRWWVLEEDC